MENGFFGIFAARSVFSLDKFPPRFYHQAKGARRGNALAAARTKGGGGMGTVKRGLRRLAHLLADLLYPRAANCLICGDPRRASEEDCLCAECRRALADRRIPAGACGRCLSPVKAGAPCAYCSSPFMKPIQRVYAPYRYAGEARALICAFKFDACGEALPLLADAMADALPDRDFDCLTPVPLHRRRLRQRGFNQALLLCEALSARTGLPVADCLERTRYRRPQSRTGREGRQRNVSGAFRVRGECAGKRILLVDDVRTTGSTAQACAQALLDAGAGSVSLCVSAAVYRKK